MQTAIQRFRSISATLRELNQAGLKMQTVNDLLTMYVGTASQHALHTTFVPFEEAVSFDREIVAYWSQLGGREVSSPLFHLPLRMGGLGVGSAVHRHAAAPWTAWHSIIPTLQEATGAPDIDSLFTPTPILRGQLRQLQVTLSQQMDTLHCFSNHWELPSVQTVPKKTLVNTIQQTAHQQLLSSLSTNNIREPSLSPKQPKTQVHTYNSPTAKLTRQTTDASESHLPDDSCYPIQPLTTQLTFHPHAPTLAPPSAHAPASSTIINYSV